MGFQVTQPPSTDLCGTQPAVPSLHHHDWMSDEVPGSWGKGTSSSASQTPALGSPFSTEPTPHRKPDLLGSSDLSQGRDQVFEKDLVNERCSIIFNNNNSKLIDIKH